METSEKTASATGAAMSSHNELNTYHQHMAEKYSNPEATPRNDKATQAIIQFNGYYALNDNAGAFFAIDTNVLVRKGQADVYDISLLISLDGITSKRFPFTGTFDGSHLYQQDSAKQVYVDLTLTHTNGPDGSTASCSGKIAMGSSPVITVYGVTFNNPIPVSMYTGSYYLVQSLYLNPDKKSEAVTKVLQITNNVVSWDYGSGTGILKPVDSYTWNLNMYYGSFPWGNATVSFIMGTAAAAGLACNNMVVDTAGKATTRSLQTITSSDVKQPGLPGPNADLLAGFSGYYPFNGITNLAFFSIQAQYVVINGKPVYGVAISVSFDGIKSLGWWFDGTMTFKDNVLNMPQQNIKITLKRQYNPQRASLVDISGNMQGSTVNSYTLLCPVPLSVFGGQPLTNAQGDKMIINNDTEVTYNGTVMKDFVYVPLMYILANPYKLPDPKPTILMSFGTSGLHGNTCIVTDLVTNKVSFVFAIPNT